MPISGKDAAPLFWDRSADAKSRFAFKTRLPDPIFQLSKEEP
jgi:hypothetical protein